MIQFTTENVEMPPIDQPKVDRWIRLVAAEYGKRVGDINYIFCDDQHILSVNRQFLQHDYYTDIITFDYCRGNQLNGDLFISLDTVNSNAEQEGTQPDEELLRIIIHGVLHLTGQADKTPETKQQMTAKEEAALRQWRKQ